MDACPPSRTAKLLLMILTFILTAAGQVGPGASADVPVLTLPPVTLAAFAELPSLKTLEVTPALKDSATTVDKAANVKGVMKLLGVRLTAGQKKFLNEHKFLMIPKRATRFKGTMGDGWEWDEMLGMFDEVGGSESVSERKPENARLVTPDVLLHAFHKYFQNSLEYLERFDLAPLLRRFLQQAQANALKYRGQSSGKLAARYEVVAAQLTVPLVILENAQWSKSYEERLKAGGGYNDLADKPDVAESLEGALEGLGKYQKQFSPEVFGRMTQEIKNIYQADGVGVSPLYGQYGKDGEVKTDYTQFTPRSHYAKTSLLRAYFRAMMYLGRNSYLLNNPEAVSDALLVAYLMASPGPDGQPLVKDWQKLMEITAFYAGASDDIGYPEWRNFVVKVLGTEKFSPAEAVNPEVLTKISQQLTELRPPRILSDVIISDSVLQQTKAELLASTKAFRIFGQRFTFDGWILGRLTAGQEKVTVRLPSTPTALFVPAALGDKTAREFAGAFLKQEAPPFSAAEVSGFYGKLDEVAADLKRVQEVEWYSSVGTAWLKLLGTLPQTFGPGYPRYMQGKLFPIKQLQTFLGSYTELKHDTLLYVKQNFAEKGGGGDEGRPPVPKGFVEPNMAFWQELARLVDYTAAGFKKYGLFNKELEEYGRLSSFKERINFYTSLAVKELSGTPLSEAEYEKLRSGNLSFLAEPLVEGAILEEKEKRSGLIADIHTDAVKGQILYEATGEPYFILALVGNEGVSRLTVGAAFNYYEFTGPLTSRYTDADWQARVYKTPPHLPLKPFWYKPLIAR
ncbi:MAG: DUF3160 domain-containing protein [Proteobacteria bacterium]|nr:DUF3160 domain-containing protein [Pseudomonadota bacterium]MBU4353839.1 DUF3160 domain-containing protein [Pseudomonadota bacterium]